MTDSGQQSLADFGGPDMERRPAEAEAEAVAGNSAGTGSDVIDPQRETLPPADGEVSIAVTQVDYTIVGDGDTERPIIHVFGRQKDGTLEHVYVRGFRPYFYAPAENVDEAELTTYDRITDWQTTDSEGNPYRSVRGTELVRIYGQTPRDVGQIRDEFEHFEADILFPDRFLIDKNIKQGLTVPARRDDEGTLIVHHDEITPATVDADPRVSFIDIEVDDRRGFPEDGEEPIVCLTTHDSRTDTYIGWLYNAPDGSTDRIETLADYEPLRENTDIEIQQYESEEAMLEAFVTYLEDTDPDVLSGWNFTDFDAPYLLDRLEVLDSRSDRDLSIDQLSRVSEVWRSDWGGPDIKGRVVFDLLYAYQRTKFTELDSYRLDDVGERELGVGKERYPGDLGDLWEQDPEQLLEYNLRDVELCVELNRTQDIIPFWNEVRSFVGCRLEDATTPGDAVDMYVLQKVHGTFALPSKGQQESEDYEGGAVFEPITGVRENVSVLDLRSLYPMCMVTTNASPETKVDPDEYDGETYRAPNGTHFRKEPDGIIREMVDELLTEREKKKSLRDEHSPDTAEYEQYDRQQKAVKVIMNSLYGVLGWDRFRLYDREMGAAVTATGREVINYTDEVVSDLGYDVVYGDTDSVMLEIGQIDSGEEDSVEVPSQIEEKYPEWDPDERKRLYRTIQKGFEIEETINESYDQFAKERLNATDHRFEIEFEKLYRRFFQAGKKKRYAGAKIWMQ